MDPDRRLEELFAEWRADVDSVAFPAIITETVVLPPIPAQRRGDEKLLDVG
ncbi:hypothetical protein [Amycolatopsis sp. CA-230715]|uniref:hypothetical protein n=1 Tax=Amycolatopsis sp. CA-230715 TaxID=2745196 RepID=UPI001C00C770|nr:hypothetical protein [Amycolatopsis sp. CA-230715]QWF78092.1 hypothetical protein HUW46_01487 [Amycolatopsis sp. CA-230715]